MRHDLIGYLLGAVDDAEQQAIRAAVERDPELQRQVELVRENLQRLEPLRLEVEPPSGLAARTCAWLDSPSAQARTGHPSIEANARDDSCGDMNRDDMNHSSPPAIPAQNRFVRRRSNDRFPDDWGGNGHSAASRRWTLPDFVVAAGVCLAAACLFFPAIVNSRYHSQLASCQNNQRELGTALINYSDVTNGFFPTIPAKGKFSVAGIYAPKLADKGLIQDARRFLCPAKGSTVVLKIPPLTDIAQARGPRLVKLQRQMGGDYAYTLGFVEKGRLQGIRNNSRSNTPLLADAPLENTRNIAIGTHGRGQNVLFEDGHVEFLATRFRPGVERQDDLFFNDDGFVHAGLHASDAVLAPSEASPMPWEDGLSD